MGSKQPVSVLVIVHTANLHVLLLERTDFPGHWQSVTGSRDQDEDLPATARRELLEETGIDADRYAGPVDWHLARQYEIFPQWRHRYAPGTTMNTEHVFSLDVGTPVPVLLSAREHLRHVWLPWREAAERCFSWTNRDAILALPDRVRAAGPRHEG
ncbi:MAG TPA: dihydroneopterin triphosphate diphosphatase [Casimicrobiaceae bacterium]|nr:dihydroneopterin triphosphate diphosphatase [Casimicrobiaceae bacterium]